jgi:hypothetical protein
MTLIGGEQALTASLREDPSLKSFKTSAPNNGNFQLMAYR